MTFFWRFPKYRHKRYRNNIILLAFLFGVTTTLYILNFLSVAIIFSLSILYAGYLILAAEKVLFPESSPIFILETLVKKGNYKEIEKRFPQKPFYIISVPGKIKWNLLWANKFIAQDRSKEAYEVYAKLLELPLFEEEESNIRLKQVLSLLLLGDTNKAKSIFERAKNKSDQSKCYDTLYLQSLFYERNGEFEKARQNMLSAVSEHDNVQNIQLAKMYNNLSRMERMLGNMTNTVHYYRKSAEMACQYHDKSLIHVVYPNIIDTYLLIEDNKNAVSFFTKYSELVDKNNIDDLLKFNNYSLEYARQTKNRVLHIETLVRGRIEILPKLSERERLVFEVSELRIRWNSQCGWDEQLFWLRHYLPEYLKLEFPSRYYLIKEIFIVLRDLARMNNLGPFAGLFSQLLESMGRSKEDIGRYLIELPDYCVDERCFWEKEKVFLRKVQKTNEPQISLREFCEGIFEHLHNIKDIQLQHGNPLAAIEADLNVADECMGLAQETGEATIILYLRNTMGEHLDNACRDLEKFSRHPVSTEYALRIARYALFLDDRERAKKYFDDFVQSKISIYHYANWLQQYYQELSGVFG